MIESTAPKEDIQIRSDFTVHVDQRVLNTLCMEARKQGINYWDKELYSDVRNVLFIRIVMPIERLYV